LALASWKRAAERRTEADEKGKTSPREASSESSSSHYVCRVFQFWNENETKNYGGDAWLDARRGDLV